MIYQDSLTKIATHVLKVAQFDYAAWVIVTDHDGAFDVIDSTPFKSAWVSSDNTIVMPGVQSAEQAIEVYHDWITNYVGDTPNDQEEESIKLGHVELVDRIKEWLE